MSNEASRILTKEKVSKIIARMAIQILENNYKEKEIVLVGVVGQGYQLAKILKKELDDFKKGPSSRIIKLEIEKSDPAASKIALSEPIENLKNCSLILVDDVINTGRTQAYGLSFLLQVPVKKVETAVLVNRSHTAFPISCTYSGIALSTTLEERIEVRLETKVGAYLS
jgi:pyrimidine operon attenuation protein/uracil phosphoribosyltransferase